MTANGEARSVAICGSGNQCSSGSTDYFILDVDRFGFTNDDCLMKESFEGAKLKADANDGWNIASVYLFLDNCESNEIVTADPDFNLWIDGDSDASRLEQTLTLKS